MGDGNRETVETEDGWETGNGIGREEEGGQMDDEGAERRRWVARDDMRGWMEGSEKG